MTFIQQQPPEVSQFMCLNQSQKVTQIDYCPNLMSICQSVQNQDITYIICTAKEGYISIVVLQQGCFINKRNVQIGYSYQSKITAITVQAIKNQGQSQSQSQSKKYNKLSKGIYVFIGFQDSTFAMYMLMQNGNMPLIHIFKIKPKLTKKQPVINIKIYKCDLIVAFSYTVVAYIKIFAKQHQDIRYNINPSKKYQNQLENILDIQANNCKINIEIDTNNQQIYVYNEYEGVVCLSLNKLTIDTKILKQIKKIQDSTKVLALYQQLQPNKNKEVANQHSKIVMIGCSDDSVKFIDYNSHIIQKFIGFKNYPTCFQVDKQIKTVWVGFLDGSIACFSQISGNTKTVDKLQKFKLVEMRTKYATKICEDGIKKLSIHNNLLVIIDNDHNIRLFDIIRNEPLSTQRQTQYQK